MFLLCLIFKKNANHTLLTVLKRGYQMSTNDREELINSEHFPVIMIRDFLLNNILGQETDDILYWSGKQLARQFPLIHVKDLQESFRYCGFGTLSLHKEERHRDIYYLTGSIIETRLLKPDASFHLEAGFLAEQIELTKGKPCEVQVKHPEQAITDTVQLIVNYE